MLKPSTTPSFASLALLAANGCCSNPEAHAVKATADHKTSAEALAPSDAAEAGREPQGERKPHLVGGYAPRAVNDPEIGLVAKTAVELLGAHERDQTLALVSIESAASQVVAGMNFALGLKVRGKAGERTLEVIVYRDLKDHFALTRATAK